MDATEWRLLTIQEACVEFGIDGETLAYLVKTGRQRTLIHYHGPFWARLTAKSTFQAAGGVFGEIDVIYEDIPIGSGEITARRIYRLISLSTTDGEPDLRAQLEAELNAHPRWVIHPTKPPKPGSSEPLIPEEDVERLRKEAQHQPALPSRRLDAPIAREFISDIRARGRLANAPPYLQKLPPELLEQLKIELQAHWPGTGHLSPKARAAIEAAAKAIDMAYVCQAT